MQYFNATSDSFVLGFKLIQNFKEKIEKMLEKYDIEIIDIENVEYEVADLKNVFNTYMERNN